MGNKKGKQRTRLRKNLAQRFMQGYGVWLTIRYYFESIDFLKL